jgi:hypothetical protein
MFADDLSAEYPVLSTEFLSESLPDGKTIGESKDLPNKEMRRSTPLKCNAIRQGALENGDL